MNQLWIKAPTETTWKVEYITPVIQEKDRAYIKKLRKQGYETKWESLSSQDILH